jgi:hypothetical protein
MICTVQISTWKDFIIDPFTLKTKLRTDLKALLEDGRILKVFHAVPNDLRILQIEFGIFVFPLVDTQLVYAQLFPGVQNIGFKDIVEWAMGEYSHLITLWTRSTSMQTSGSDLCRRRSQNMQKETLITCTESGRS